MSTEIERYRPANFDERLRFAQLMAQADMLPEAYRDKPANVLLIMDYGDSLGIPYSQAISLINVMDGKPTASAALVSALVRKAGHQLLIDSDNASLTATATIIRADHPDRPFSSTWTIARAAQADLCQINPDGTPHARSRHGNKLAWEKYPIALLKARAITEVAREACQEALMGIQYTAEELGAAVDVDGNVIDAEPIHVDSTQQPPAEPPQQAASAPPATDDATTPTKSVRAAKAKPRASAKTVKPAEAPPTEPDQAAGEHTDQTEPDQGDQAPPAEDDVDWGNYFILRLGEAEQERNMEQIQALATEAKERGATDLIAEAQHAWRRAATDDRNGN